ncbi:tRNA (adenosine(37)-N6)-threonylcarbamoyltransferase complex dimerization subunit type 1 TsaB [Burkholderiaceae bacterium DAT-1]|nr:tRNA (adenosine(37)-N6)-threonylcarbamoyltransferase complex dimerization subunit type 1 TsaB [Burkholderiaceae bacterium DAT-1]
MNLLAIDTSTEFLSIALEAKGQLHVHEVLAGQLHAELTLPTVQTLCANAGIPLAAIDGIAFSVGPGSFTGLRIGCGIVQGLAFGLGKPVVGVNSLASMAASVEGERILAVNDARMGELYLAGFVREGDVLKEVLHTCVVKPDALPDLPPGNWVGAGSGFKVQGEALANRYGATLIQTLPDVFPNARGLLALARPVFAAGQAYAPEKLELLYIRNKVALTATEQAALRKAG